MSDWSDLVDLAGDLIGDEDFQKLMKKGRKFLQKAEKHLSLTPSAAESAPAAGNAGEVAAQTMLPERLTPEPLVPEKMTPQNEVPEGESAYRAPLCPAPPEETEAMRYLTHICNQGIRGAMITNEILEPPLALRSGYLARYRRRLR